MADTAAEAIPNAYDLNDLYPDPFQIFAYRPESIESVLGNCIFVLDTNVLLVPYGTGKESLKEIDRIYSELVQSERLIIPAQVAREFAANRSNRIATLFQQIGAKCNNNIALSSYPLLESLEGYEKLLVEERKAIHAVKAYRDALQEVMGLIRAWRWDDPVSSLYRKLFAGEVIVQPKINNEVFRSEAKERYAKKIPPGYKDGAKTENLFGDLLIWKTILQVGYDRKTHVVFVSGEEKPDWWHRSNKAPLFPRYELVEEFRRYTEGKTFHILSFADFLKHFGAGKMTVSQVEAEGQEIERQLEAKMLGIETTFARRGSQLAQRSIRRSIPNGTR